MVKSIPHEENLESDSIRLYLTKVVVPSVVVDPN